MAIYFLNLKYGSFLEIAIKPHVVVPYSDLGGNSKSLTFISAIILWCKKSSGFLDDVVAAVALEGVFFELLVQISESKRWTPKFEGIRSSCRAFPVLVRCFLSSVPLQTPVFCIGSLVL